MKVKINKPINPRKVNSSLRHLKNVWFTESIVKKISENDKLNFFSPAHLKENTFLVYPLNIKFMLKKNKWWFQFLFFWSAKSVTVYWHVVYLPNIRKCMFVTGLYDPHANRTHFVGLLILSSESDRAAASSVVVDGNSSVIIISGSETGNFLMSTYILCFYYFLLLIIQ